jgi:hypothetical protein
MRKSALMMMALLVAGSVQAARPMRGTYEIPVQDPALEPYAKFPVKFKSEQYESDPNSLEFPLPEELVGTPTTIRMEKTDPATGTFVGEGAEGGCERSGRMLICRMAFSGLPFDPAASDALIDARFGVAEAGFRKKVAEVFRSQPIGILKYRLRGRSD